MPEKREKHKKPGWLVMAENKIEKMTDEEFNKVFEKTYAKLKKGGLREVFEIRRACRKTKNKK